MGVSTHIGETFNSKEKLYFYNEKLILLEKIYTKYARHYAEKSQSNDKLEITNEVVCIGHDSIIKYTINNVDTFNYNAIQSYINKLLQDIKSALKKI